MFIRTLILAGALATALVPISSAPARAADPADVAKIVGGIATLYIVGRAVSQARADDDDDDDKERVQEVRDNRLRWTGNRHDERAFQRSGDRFGRGWHGSRSERGGRYEYRDRRNRHWRGERDQRDDRVERGRGRHGQVERSRPALPAACQRAMRVRNQGNQYVLGPGCLARAGYSWRDLPRSCRVSVQSRFGWRDAYHSHCLKQAGYRIRR